MQHGCPKQVFFCELTCFLPLPGSPNSFFNISACTAKSAIKAKRLCFDICRPNPGFLQNSGQSSGNFKENTSKRHLFHISLSYNPQFEQNKKINQNSQYHRNDNRHCIGVGKEIDTFVAKSCRPAMIREAIIGKTKVLFTSCR